MPADYIDVDFMCMVCFPITKYLSLKYVLYVIEKENKLMFLLNLFKNKNLKRFVLSGITLCALGVKRSKLVSLTVI